MTGARTPPELVIFDCDGVLVDSEPIANRVLAAAITLLGHPISVAETRAAFVGLSMARILQNLTQLTRRPLPDDWREQVQAETYAAFRQSLRPVPGALEAVARIQAANIPFCVASSGSLDKMELTLGLTGLRSYFGDRLFSSTMVARGKPHPDLFLYAAAQMGVGSDRAIVIEDSVPGVTGARAAGMGVFAYAGDPESDVAKLRAEGGEIFTAMADLPSLLGLK